MRPAEQYPLSVRAEADKMLGYLVKGSDPERARALFQSSLARCDATESPDAPVDNAVIVDSVRALALPSLRSRRRGETCWPLH